MDGSASLSRAVPEDVLRPTLRDEPAPDVFSKAYEFRRADEVRALGLYPYFVPIEASDATEVTVEGRRLVMVGSNNYLGLNHDPRVIAAAQEAMSKYGSACTGSRFLNGNTDLHDRLEVELARLTGKPAALVFPTGFQTNLGVISALVGRNDTVFIDKLDHASIVDGCFLSPGETVRFRHGDLDDLDAKLARVPSRGKIVAVDGVFSMEGDIVDLPRVVEICERHGSRLLVDDAHSVGVLGATGAGTAEHFGITSKVDLIVGTFSKAFASIGGFVAGERSVIQYLKHHARPLIFSASMPPSACAAVLACIEILRAEPERREQLWAHGRRMRDELKGLGFDVGGAEAPIVPVIIGGDLQTFAFWKRLFDEGVYTNPVISPAVPEHSARIRTSYIATHTNEQLDFVLEVFHKVGKEMGVI